MLVSEMLTKTKLRERISDTLSVSFTDAEIISYINDGINMVWNQLADRGYYELVKDKTFTSDTEPLPADFMRFEAKYPILLKSDGTASTYGTTPIETRYLRKPTFVTAVTDALPFTNDSLNLLIGQIATMFALNRNEYDVTFEKQIIDEIRKSIG